MRESEARFRLLGETAPIIIALADGDGNPTYVNPYWETFSGHTGEEYLAGAYRTALLARRTGELTWTGREVRLTDPAALARSIGRMPVRVSI